MLNAVNAKALGMGGPRTAAENRVLLQQALDTGRSVFLDTMALLIEPGLVMRANGQTVFGMGTSQTRLIVQGSGNLFATEGRHDCAFRDFTISGQHASGNHTAGFAIVVNGSPTHATQPQQVWGANIEGLVIEGCAGGIYITDANIIHIEKVEMRAMRGDGIVAHALTSNHRIDLLRVANFSYSLAAASRAAGIGCGIVIDGEVHGVRIDTADIVRPATGILIANSAGLPLGKFPAFVFLDAVAVDYPLGSALQADAVERLRASQCYFHGSEASNGVVLGANVRESALVNCNVTGHRWNGLVHQGYNLDLIGCTFNHNSQGAVNGASAVLLETGARNVRVVGGAANEGQHAYGIFRRDGAATGLSLAAADHYYGGVAHIV